MGKKEIKAINKSIQVFKGNLKNLTKKQTESKEFRENMFYYESKCRGDRACNRVMKHLNMEKGPSDNLFEFAVKTLSIIVQWCARMHYADDQGKTAYALKLTFKEFKKFNAL